RASTQPPAVICVTSVAAYPCLLPLLPPLLLARRRPPPPPTLFPYTTLFRSVTFTSLVREQLPAHRPPSMRPKQPRQRSPVLERRDRKTTPLNSRHEGPPRAGPNQQQLIRAATGHPFVVRVTAVAGDPVVAAR